MIARATDYINVLNEVIRWSKFNTPRLKGKVHVLALEDYLTPSDDEIPQCGACEAPSALHDIASISPDRCVGSTGLCPAGSQHQRCCNYCANDRGNEDHRPSDYRHGKDNRFDIDDRRHNHKSFDE